MTRAEIKCPLPLTALSQTYASEEYRGSFVSPSSFPTPGRTVTDIFTVDSPYNNSAG